jgi:hypothetical protein
MQWKQLAPVEFALGQYEVLLVIPRLDNKSGIAMQ